MYEVDICLGSAHVDGVGGRDKYICIESFEPFFEKNTFESLSSKSSKIQKIYLKILSLIITNPFEFTSCLILVFFALELYRNVERFDHHLELLFK